MSRSDSVGRLYLVQQLGTLPREISDKIIDNLTLFKVLQLATLADSVVTGYILEHDHYGRTFMSAANLAAAVSRFAIWCQVKMACGWRNDRHYFPLSPVSSLFRKMTYSAIMRSMMEDIQEGHGRGCKYARLLSQFSPEPISPGRANTERCLKQDLQKLWAAQETLKKLESRQLTILADFLETYPHMLRWARDPRGDASTTPSEHNIRKLRVYAKKVFNTQYMRHRKPVYVMSAFRNGVMPLVPKNWCLKLLLRSDLPVDVLNFEASQRTSVKRTTEALRHTSLATPGKQMQDGSKQLQSLNDHPSEATETPDPFPPHVKNDLRTVLKGFRYRYSRSNHITDGNPIARVSAPERIKNIKSFFSRSSEERKRIIERDSPSFFVASPFKVQAEELIVKKQIRSYWNEGTDDQIMSILPYHEQEVEWLGAFLRSIAYLEAREMSSKMREE